mmetsp:Transcript_16152/g.19623  ORF Transcript_16152/g.19623 Transcript_16152/m.19623 type:complete len:316 (+) Transcript_16152:107-1054(+)|eukprot:CAMPEP_0184032274 /NCGR_PEP_ID=MMETSP0955-20130417/2905_1 /TAXON_ID=627963 /ORGANISM="Aplanochytrium sp, Strain PBS07" /LENGTH=315 /DNA_ID=CAMNT_0026318287 /DNA_START=103 /DNA_END=1050 /DNA_ORIENTATION=-
MSFVRWSSRFSSRGLVNLKRRRVAGYGGVYVDSGCGSLSSRVLSNNIVQVDFRQQFTTKVQNIEKNNESDKKKPISSFAKKAAEQEKMLMEDQDKTKTGQKGRAKLWDLVQKYGAVFTVYWGTLYVGSAGAIYVGLGYTGAEFGLEFARSIYLDRLVNLDALDPRSGNLILALLLNEGAEIIRLPFVAATVPFVTKKWEAIAGPRMETKKKKKGMASMIQEHGKFFLGYWTFLWLSTGLSCYAAIEVLGPEAALTSLKYVGADQLIDLDSINPKYYNMGFAIAINELIEPIRFPFTIATLTTVKRWTGLDKEKLE